MALARNDQPFCRLIEHEAATLKNRAKVKQMTTKPYYCYDIF
jgi:hypothetical protein